MSCPFIPIDTAELEWRNGLPYSKLFDDIYFSGENGFEESRHVFIDGNQLTERWQKMPLSGHCSFVIAETGFGTGLNFLLTWSLWLKHAPESCCLHFISCEKFPLSKSDLAKCLALWPELTELAAQLMRKYPVLTPGFHTLNFNERRVKLTLMLGDVVDCFQQLLICGDRALEEKLRGSFIDAWYLDGFAPGKNEDMWTKELFSLMQLLSKKGTTIATYSAARLVKEHLQHFGFSVSKRKGYARKRDMTIAYFHHSPQPENKKRQTPWHISKPLNPKKKKAIVLGAGLAGCFLTHSLTKRGWKVSLIEASDKLASGASANTQAVLFPKLSAYRSPLTEFMLAGFLFSVDFYKDLLSQISLGCLNGILLLAYHEKEKNAQLALKNWLRHYPELACLVSKNEASELAGVHLPCGGMFIPYSGWINSQALCNHLIHSINVDLCLNTKVENIQYENGLWHVADQQAEVLVIANGYQATQFHQTSYLPIKPIRGQMSAIAATSESSRLKLAVCANGHVLPATNASHWIGATYDLGEEKNVYKIEDDQKNIHRLREYIPHLNWSDTIIDSWTAVRATTPDYLPLVGPVANTDSFKNQYKKFAVNANIWLPEIADYYQGLFLCTGFGSRGLTTIPLATEFLASLINNEISVLPTKLSKAISPARFLRKQLIRGL